MDGELAEADYLRVNGAELQLCLRCQCIVASTVIHVGRPERRDAGGVIDALDLCIGPIFSLHPFWVYLIPLFFLSFSGIQSSACSTVQGGTASF